ncbi:MAG: glutathione-disulfide reductase [Pseudomonadales bacterium]
MSEYDYDLVVIGAGSGGVRAARMSASMGAKVAIIEDRYWGGTCVNVGCVPKKLYYYASHISESVEDAAGFGWHVDKCSFEWRTLVDNKTAEIKRLNGIYRRILGDVDVEQIEGRGKITGPHSVQVNQDKDISAARILVATGGWPFVPEFPGSQHVIHSNDVFDLASLPQRMIIVGGGYIAVEFAGIFNGLGVETHLVYRGPKLLRNFDVDVAAAVTEEMIKKGVNIHFNTNISFIAEEAHKLYSVTLENGDTLMSGPVLMATGRKPNIEGLGLEQVGVKLTETGTIAVDALYQTSCDSIYALGDVIDGPELTPVALAEGMTLARHLYGGGSEPLDYDYIPTAVFCQPNIGTVGLTEAEARKRYDNVSIYSSRFTHLKHTLSGNPSKTFMKLIVDDASDRVVGMHMVGDDAGEIIQGFAVAMKAGATKAVFDATIGIHPTAAEEFVTMRVADQS